MNVKITIVSVEGIPKASRLDVKVGGGYYCGHVISHLMDLNSEYALYDLASAFSCVARELTKLYEKQNPRDTSSSAGQTGKDV